MILNLFSWKKYIFHSRKERHVLLYNYRSLKYTKDSFSRFIIVSGQSESAKKCEVFTPPKLNLWSCSISFSCGVLATVVNTQLCVWTKQLYSSVVFDIIVSLNNCWKINPASKTFYCVVKMLPRFGNARQILKRADLKKTNCRIRAAVVR